MKELTEQQEQEMIERAKAGDPEANYKMSLWALDQAMAEPEEERWNRLAAKCLVKSAEAGYAPAKAKMDELLQAAEAQTAYAGTSSADADSQNSAFGAGNTSSVQFSKVAGQAGAVAKKAGKAAGKAAVKAGKAIASGASSLSRKAKERMVQSAQNKESGQNSPVAGNHAGRKSSSILPDFSQWDDAKWKKMQIACVIVCVILALLIAILIINGTRRRNKNTPEDATTLIPAATTADANDLGEATGPDTSAGGNANANANTDADTAGDAEGGADTDAQQTTEVTPAPAAAEDDSYPSQAVKDEIAAASLNVYPSESDYVEEERTVRVINVNQSLNMRSGPGTTYNLVGSLPRDAEVPVYANRNGWALVKYNDTWGWCSYDYLGS